MLDDHELLQETPGLLDLLRHYAELAQPDRQAWHDRLMSHDRHDPRGLTRLHGDLLAGGWIEQNTGHTVTGRGGVAACYRITSAGLRILHEI